MSASGFDTAESLRLHDAFGRIEDEFNAILDESLAPRGPEMLYGIVAGFGLLPGGNAIDIGCGEGRHTVELARRFGLHVLGVDPLDRHLAIAAEAEAVNAGTDGKARFESGTAEHLPAGDASFDLVWCRDVFSLAADLEVAYGEIRRVLKPGGYALIYQMFATELLEPREAAWLLPTMGCLAANMDPAVAEAAIRGAGLGIEACHVFGPEWGEYAQEQTGRGATKLIRAARLVRDPERYVARFERANYEIALGDNLWHVYRLIGKLSDRVYVLRAP